MSAVKALYSILLYVQNLDASVEFYRDQLGLEQTGPADDGVILLHTDDVVLVLHRADEGSDWPVPGMSHKPGGHSLTFQVDDPDAWAASLSNAGVEIARGPLDQAWGRVVFLTDPDDRIIALARPEF